MRKPVFGVSNQIRHKPGCTTMIVRLSLLRKTILIPEYLAFMCVCVFVDGCNIPYPKCPPLQLFSARIPCGHLTDVHAEYWNTMSATSARRQKKNYQKKRADVRWNSCRTIMRTQRTSVGHSVPILRICWNFMRTSAECPLDVRQNVRRMSARMSVGRPQNFRRTSAECPSHPPECPLDVR